MDLRKLKTLIDLVSESGISELEVNEGEDRVRIVNSGSAAPAGQTVYANPAPVHAAPATPIANPESPNFVSIGDTVKVGQTLCIIEAMKLLNEIESEYAGVVKEILCENGQGVEFDQPLFIIA
jgi:acetyl-CoA carboxylase biotin carboxyl carrier protein